MYFQSMLQARFSTTLPTTAIVEGEANKSQGCSSSSEDEK